MRTFWGIESFSFFTIYACAHDFHLQTANFDLHQDDFSLLVLSLLYLVISTGICFVFFFCVFFAWPQIFTKEFLLRIPPLTEVGCVVLLNCFFIFSCGCLSIVVPIIQYHIYLLHIIFSANPSHRQFPDCLDKRRLQFQNYRWQTSWRKETVETLSTKNQTTTIAKVWYVVMNTAH